MEESQDLRKYEAALDGWEIVRRLGRGSVGRVYEICSASRPEEKAALKVISLPDGSDDIRMALSSGIRQEDLPKYFHRVMQVFISEYEHMELLKGNEHIVEYSDHTIIPHDDGVGGDILIRMELLTPLIDHALLHEIDEDDVIGLGLDIADALAACEKANILHRDIKPDNIFVSEDGKFKLGDFGVARLIEETEMNLSHKGTYAYMAPEVYRGEEYGKTADIYSLGLVMYKYLNNGRLPFMPRFPEEIGYEDSDRALSRRIRKESLLPPEQGSPALQAVVLKACSADPASRFSNASELREALEAVREGTASHAVPGHVSGDHGRAGMRRRIAIALIAVAALAAAVRAAIPRAVTDITGVEDGQKIYIGEAILPDYKVEPDWFSDEPISFEPADEEVLSVDKQGRLTGAGIGETDLVLSARGYSETAHIMVVPKITKIGGVDAEIGLPEGETVRLTPRLYPDKFSDEPVEYTSSDTDIAEVSDDGTIAAVSAGETSVTISAGGCSKVIVVTVTAEQQPVYYSAPASGGSSSGSAGRQSSGGGSQSSNGGDSQTGNEGGSQSSNEQSSRPSGNKDNDSGSSVVAKEKSGGSSKEKSGPVAMPDSGDYIDSIDDEYFD